jgi:hypothetical protein
MGMIWTMYDLNKMRGNVKDKINERVMNSKNKNIRDLYRGIYEFKRGTNLEVT